MKTTWSVIGIPPEATHDWLLKKHYAKRIPSIMYSFGVYVGHLLQGIITYGEPASPPLCKGICGEIHSDSVIELNRLCISDDHDANLASYFVSRSLRLLPKPSIVVAFADTHMQHIGYVYQASNFLYTGLSARHLDWVESGANAHSRSTVRSFTTEQRLADPERFIQVEHTRKHRYVYFTGTRKQVKKLQGDLNYPIQPYPKGEPAQYDSGLDVPTQMALLS